MDREPLAVLVVIDTLRTGGAERLLVTFARRARGLGVRLTVATLRPPPPDGVLDALTGAGTRVVVVPTRWRRSLADPRRPVTLRGLAAGHDVVHTHLRTAHLLGVPAARAARRPVIATLHNVPSPGGGLRDRLEAATLRRADVVTAVSSTVADGHRRRLGFTPEVIANPVPDLARGGGPAPVRPPDRPLVVSVGRLHPQKGFDVLIDAVARLARDGRAPLVWIMGTGAEHRTLASRIGRAGLDGVIRLVGHRDDVPAVVAAADLFVLPSRWEGLPLALLEAVAVGTPVVATGVGEVPRLLDSGSAWLVPPGDPESLARAVAEALSDPGEAARRAARARDRIRDLDPDTWARRWRDRYDAVRRGRPRGSRRGQEPAARRR